MAGTLILVALLGLLLAAVLLRATRGQSVRLGKLELEGHSQPVDLAAFCNLIDPAEAEFLRLRLSPVQFRAVERQRLRAAAEYGQCIARNASILLHLGKAVARQNDLETAAAARAIVNSALRLRVNAFLALAVIYTRIAFPGARISLGRVVGAYQNLTDKAQRLGQLQNPADRAQTSVG